MTRPDRRPAAVPQIGKAPSTGHPARPPDTSVPAPPPVPMQPPPAPQEQLVNFGGRIPAGTRRRLRIFATLNERDIQDLLNESIIEYLDRHGG